MLLRWSLPSTPGQTARCSRRYSCSISGRNRITAACRREWRENPLRSEEVIPIGCRIRQTPRRASNGERAAMTARAGHEAPGLRREVLADGVYEAIKTLIMDRGIEPGAKINMESVSRDLDVSPTPVREALARLESDGLVTKKPLVGYTAAPLLDARGLDELFELRLMLEPVAARWAAGGITAPRVAELSRMLTDVREFSGTASGDDYRGYREVALHDGQFHDAIAEASG